MRFSYYDKARTAIPVPEPISFSNYCLAIPTMRMARIPSICAKLPIIETKVAIGDWVQRDQILLTAKIPVFDRFSPPPKWQFWIDDSFTFLEYELTSPVSGLVINMAKHYSAYYGESYATSSGNSLCFGEIEVLPILLIPEDEPTPYQGAYSFFSTVLDSLKINWHRLLYSSVDGYVRCSDVLHTFEESDQMECRKFLKSEGTSAPKVKIVSLDQLQGADQYITEMRAHNIVLRNKLRHLGGRAI